MPGPGFLGEYEFVFIGTEITGRKTRISIGITIEHL